MALTLNGSTGITSANIADGTITNADVSASAAIDASKLDADVVSKDASGNVGIGTSNPDTNLSIYHATDNTSINVNTGTGGSYPKKTGISFGATSTSLGGDIDFRGGAGIQAINTAASGNPTDLIFWTNHTGSPAERMRITSSGNVLVGTTSSTGSGASSGVQVNQFNGSLTNGLYIDDTRTSIGTDVAIIFGRGATEVGSIKTTLTSTSYNTSSDYRLKENVVPMTGSIDRLKALKPSRFNFIADADTTVDGFLAHEAQEVVPEAVSGEKDAMRTEEYEVTPAVKDDDGNVVTEAVMGEREVEDYQGIDQSKLSPLIVGALQEAIAKIESLEAEVALLKGN